VLSRDNNTSCLLTSALFFVINYLVYLLSNKIKMKNNLTVFIDKLITLILLVVAGVTPLLFLIKLPNFMKCPKLIFYCSNYNLTGIIYFPWILKGKVTINRTPLMFRYWSFWPLSWFQPTSAEQDIRRSMGFS